MPVDDIVVLLMADYGVNLYGNAIIVNPKFAAEKPEAVKGFLRAFVKGLKDTVKIAGHRGRLGDQAQRRRQEGRSSSSACSMALKRQHRHRRGEGERLSAASTMRPLRQGDRPDRASPTSSRTRSRRREDIFDASFLPAAADRKAN